MADDPVVIAPLKPALDLAEYQLKIRDAYSAVCLMTFVAIIALWTSKPPQRPGDSIFRTFIGD
jgi:hypothetical protein